VSFSVLSSEGLGNEVDIDAVTRSVWCLENRDDARHRRSTVSCRSLASLFRKAVLLRKKFERNKRGAGGKLKADPRGSVTARSNTELQPTLAVRGQVIRYSTVTSGVSR
jgi:hypothetical protein